MIMHILNIIYAYCYKRVDEFIAWCAGLGGFSLSHQFHLQLLQIPPNPYFGEIVIQGIRMVFTIFTAVGVYMSVRHVKKKMK